MNFAFKYQPMGIVIVLLCVSLLVAVFFLGAYIWGVRSGQFDDDQAPAYRIFFDDKIRPESRNRTNNNQ